MLVLLGISTPALATPPETQAAASTPVEKPSAEPGSPGAKAGEQKPAATKVTVELLTPTPLDVTTNAGVGAMPFRLLLTGAATEITAIDATPPIADGQALAGTVTVRVESSTPMPENQRILAAVLEVKAAPPIAPNVKFSGMLLLPTIGGRVPYSITDKTNVVLTSSPDKIAMTWLVWQPDVARLQVRNTGTSAFALSTAAASLEDAGTKRRVEEAVEIEPRDQPFTIGPGQSRQIAVRLPRPSLAGTYAGTLTLRSQTDTLSLPLTITTRGPSPRGHVWIPFLLFVVTVIAGIWMSSRLEAFFGEGGGLRRAEAVVALGTLENDLTRVHKGLAEFLGRENLNLPRVLARFSPLIEAVRTARTVPNVPNVDTVLREARAAQLAGMLLQRLLQASVAALKTDPQALAALVKAVEALQWPSDDASFEAFDQQLRAAIDTVHKDMQSRAAAADPTELNEAAPRTTEPLLLPQGSPVTVDEALDQIRRMTRLQQAGIWLLTVLTAYQTFYVSNAAFGTAFNYIALFMWSLGITQAGTQIVARARRPATP
jgi:hypothetical protein